MARIISRFDTKNIKEASAGLQLAAMALALGQACHRVQPWFGLAEAGFFFILAMLWFRNMRRYSRTTSTIVREKPCAFLTGVIYLAITLSVLVVAFWSGTWVYWVALSCLSVGIGLAYFVFGPKSWSVNHKLKDLKEVLSGLRTLTTAVRDDGEDGDDEGTEEDDEKVATEENASRIVSQAVVSLVYLMIFLPLTIHVAMMHDLNVLDVLLFSHFSKMVLGSGILAQMAKWVSDPMFFLPFGVLYGVSCFVFTLMSLSLRKKALVEVVIMSNGLLFGYALTVTFTALVFRQNISKNLMSWSQLRFVYVLATYYVLRSLTDIVAQWGIRAKYEYAIGGIQSIITAEILARMYGPEAVVFSGLVFFLCTFVMTSVFEATIGRVVKWLGAVLGEKPMASGISLGKLIKSSPRGFWRETGVATLIFALFPILVFGVVKLILASM